MKYATTRVVYDRKKQATNEKKALVQVEIFFGRKKRYVGTGVKVTKSQWSDKKQQVIKCDDCVLLNNRIAEVKQQIDNVLLNMMKSGMAFSWEEFDAQYNVSEEKKMTFVEWCEERIASRTDIKGSTRRTQNQLVSNLEKFGKIKTFADVTKQNVMLYDEWLHSIGIKQSTISTRIKWLKIYVNEALNMGLIDKNPFLGLKFKRGEPRSDRYLTEEEYRAIRDCEPVTDSLRRVRDLFVVECMTGLAYSDLMDADFRNVEIKENGNVTYEGKRHKTGESYYFVLLQDAIDVLKRYDWVLPRFSNVQYNMRLKLVAQCAGIDKPISSHWARHTLAMTLLNRGMPIEIVAKVLGHASISTTQSTYAKVLNKTIDDAFDKLDL